MCSNTQHGKILLQDISRCLQIISESVAENKIKQLDLGKWNWQYQSFTLMPHQKHFCCWVHFQLYPGDKKWRLNMTRFLKIKTWITALKGVKTEWVQVLANSIRFAIYVVKSKQTYQTSKTITMTWWLEVRYALQLVPIRYHLLPLCITHFNNGVPVAQW